MTDESIMPFGKYKDQKLANVDASYLIWLYENNKVFGELKTYIFDNLDVLRSEIRNKRNNQR